MSLQKSIKLKLGIRVSSNIPVLTALMRQFPDGFFLLTKFNSYIIIRIWGVYKGHISIK